MRNLICYALAALSGVVHQSADSVLDNRQEERIVILKGEVSKCASRPIEHDTLVNYVVDTVERIVEIKVPFKVYVDTCTKDFASSGPYYVKHDSLIAPTTHGDYKHPVIVPHVEPKISEPK